MSTLRKRHVSKPDARRATSEESSSSASKTDNLTTEFPPDDDTARLYNRHHLPSSIREDSGAEVTDHNPPLSPSSSPSCAPKSSNDNELAHIDLHFRYVSIFGVICYIVLVAFSYYMTPPENIKYLEGYEKSAPLLAFLILVVSCITHVLPLFYRRTSFAKTPSTTATTAASSSQKERRRTPNTLSGVLIGALTVQVVACVSDALMAFGRTPILTDPILGTRVYLLRWCEWTPLAFIMTFLTEGCAIHHHPQDISSTVNKGNESKMKLLIPSYFNASCQGLSTFCGLLFPFCKNFAGTKNYVLLWTVLMIASCALFAVIFPRCVYQWKEFQKLEEQFDAKHVMHKQTQTKLNENGDKAAGASSTPTVDEMEVYDRARLSLRLLFTCATMWTILVLSYFISGCFSLYREYFSIDSDSIWLDPALTMISECTMDVLAKVLYLHIIVEVHEAVFDEGVKAERRLEELRKMMSVVWENSSDVIAISVRGGIKGDVTTMVSPTYLQIYNQSLMEDVVEFQNDEYAKRRALVFELDAKCFKVHQRKQQQNPNAENAFGMESFSERGSGIEVQPPIAPLSVHPRAVYDTEFCSLSSLNQQHHHVDGNIAGHGGGRRNSNASFTSSARSVNNELDISGHKSIRQEEISSMADLVVRAWTHEGSTEALLMHDLIRRQNNENGPAQSSNDKQGQDEALEFDTIRCEAKINRLQENALVIVVRDISERFRRFEAEKRVVFETTAREKDAEANRFTRHEVKNGLLAAIGLCEGLKETMCESGSGLNSSVVGNRNLLMADPSTSNSLSSSSHHHLSLGTMMDTSSRLITELDKTLREVLDTILAEAMARDVIHEVYEPRSERVDICELLCGISATQGYRDVVNTDYSSSSHRSERFPLIVHPSPLPHLSFDPQLLRYIHRNAVSNACKYGQRGGVVLTEVIYDDRERMVHMAVINLPGEHHDKLLAMGNDVAGGIVFSPGQRLHRHFELEKQKKNGVGTEVSHSSGDGAWIMQKCAKTLSGDCSITFESTRTIFSLRFPAVPYDVSIRGQKASDLTEFRLPPHTWGIAIDDSKIQRKLLERYFGMVGIQKDRTIVLGKDADEISGFADYVVDFIEQRQKVEEENHYYLIIADENLDIMEDETHYVTVSGSLCVENIRRRLLPDQERQVCALIRSANDSSQDVAIYNSRAHGFLPKVPIKKDRVMETLAPLWEQRYPPNHGKGSSTSSGASASSRLFNNYGEDSHSNDRREESSASAKQVDGSQVATNSSSDSSSDSEERLSSGSKKHMDNKNSDNDHETGDSDDYDKISAADLMQIIGEIDALCTVEGKNGDKQPPEELWPLVWEKLHSLKGDLQTMYNSATVVNLIKSLRGPVLPDNFVECWNSIRTLIVSMQ